jgi:hypothetical protein
MPARNYSSIAPEMTLQAGVNSSATSWAVDVVTGVPPTPFSVIADPGLATEEVITVTGVAGTTLTVVRGQDGTATSSHGTGAKLRHGTSARDFQEANDHVNATTGVHGIAGAVVGTTDIQTIDRKTFLSSDATGAPLTVQAQAGQSDAIIDVKASGGASVASVMPSGRVATPGIDGGSQSVFTAGAAATIPLVAKGAPSQTADLLVGRTSGNSDVFRVTPLGRVLVPGVDGTGQSVFTPDVAGTTPVKVKGAASQTADLFLVTTSADAQLLAITASGRIETVGLDAGRTEFTPAVTTDVPLMIRSIASQTSNATEWRNSSDGVTASVDTSGRATFNRVTESSPAAWTPYTPTIRGSGSGGANGNAVVTARWVQIGRVVHVMIDFVVGTTTSFGTGNTFMTLPVNARAVAPHLVGHGSLFNDSTGERLICSAMIPSNETEFTIVAENSEQVSGSLPWVWAVDDYLRFNLMYEAA